MTDLDSFLERNRTFANSGGHQNLVSSPGRRVVVLTCVDPRVDPAHFMGIGLGEGIVVRNVGGRVTDEVISALVFLVARMEARSPDGVANLDVAVIHHTDCGTKMLADPDFRSGMASRLGADEAELATRAVTDPAETVREDVDMLRSSPLVPDSVVVSGHVYDIGTGLVTTIVSAGS